MNPTPDTPTPPPESQAAPAPQPIAPASPPPAPAFTQAQVDAMLADAKKQAYDSAYAQARRTFEQKGNGASTPTQTQPTPSPAPAAPGGMTFADLARYDAFKDAVAAHSVPPAGRALLMERFMSSPPADVVTWVSEQAAAFGWAKQTSPTQPAGSQPSGAPVVQATPPTPPTSTPSGSPPAPSAGVYDPKPSQMKPADVQAYVAKHGPKAWMALVRQELAGTRVTPPPRR